MKRLLFIFLLFLVGVGGFGQNDATLKETIDWLKGKIDEIADEDGIISRVGDSRTLSFNYQTCELIIKDVGVGSVSYTATEYIPLSKMDPSSIIIVDTELSSVMVSLKSFGDKQVIRRTVVEQWEGGKVRNVTDNQLQFHFDLSSKQNDIPARVKKALQHAIRLCGVDEKF